MNRPFVPADSVDFYDNEAAFIHANPNVIACVKIVPSDYVVYPFKVETTLITNEIIDYYFKTIPEAKAFIRKLGDIK